MEPFFFPQIPACHAALIALSNCMIYEMKLGKLMIHCWNDQSRLSSVRFSCPLNHSALAHWDHGDPFGGSLGSLCLSDLRLIP